MRAPDMLQHVEHFVGLAKGRSFLDQAFCRWAHLNIVTAVPDFVSKNDDKLNLYPKMMTG